jgi:hypothetical protein
MRKNFVILHSQVKQHTLAMNKRKQTKEDIIAKMKILILTKQTDGTFQNMRKLYATEHRSAI